jgi:hypothetical protein
MNTISSKAITLIQLILDKLDQVNSVTKSKVLGMESELLTDTEMLMDNFNLDIFHSILLSLLQLLRENSMLDVIEYEFPDLSFDVLQLKSYIALLEYKSREFVIA